MPVSPPPLPEPRTVVKAPKTPQVVGSVPVSDVVAHTPVVGSPVPERPCTPESPLSRTLTAEKKSTPDGKFGPSMAYI